MLAPAPHNFEPRFNVCPTTTIDTIIAPEGKRELTRARWGLVPSWWSTPPTIMEIRADMISGMDRSAIMTPRREVATHTEALDLPNCITICEGHLSELKFRSFQ